MKAIEKNLLILEEMWNRTLTVDLIAEKLVCRQNHDLSRAVAKYMDERHWDVIGICGKAEGAKAHAYVHREDLNTADTCEDARSEFSVDRLVSGHTPIRQCFLRIIEQDWLFVLGPKGVDGIVTCADLQKQPACMMLFATVSLLETALTTAIRELHSDDSWMQVLSQNRIDKARKLLTERAKREQDLDLIDCLQMGDKSDIIAKNKDLRQMLGWESRNAAKKSLKNLQTLRNNLAHAHDPTGGTTWQEVGETFTQAEAMLQVLTNGPVSEHETPDAKREDTSR